MLHAPGNSSKSYSNVVVRTPAPNIARRSAPASLPKGDQASRGSEDRLAVLQVWRFIAASAVVLLHAHQRAVRAFPEQTSSIFGFGDLATFGNFGVDLFFVISGFIMTWTNWERFGTSPAEFWKRRIARIVPV